ncbi:phosphoribosyltransferase [Primorskyibacter sp. S87]|uniref:phosphoribosyltransferase n=1 Tax=Primorskyibacter sp. S87 TaxID=3415126 RepID=UPI003C7BB802
MFEDREQAAIRLADAVAEQTPKNPLVLALPRGGVPLAVKVSERLGAPLDLLLVRKIGMPGNPEYAAGAVVGGTEPITLFNDRSLASQGLSPADFKGQVTKLLSEIERRRDVYLKGRQKQPVAGRTAILVDDGIATGATVRVAVKALRQQGPSAIWVAVPVAPKDAREILETEADRVICLETPTPFIAVGVHYRQFGQVSDEEVVRLLSPE